MDDELYQAERYVIEKAIEFRAARGNERQPAENDLRRAVKRLLAARMEVAA